MAIARGTVARTILIVLVAAVCCVSCSGFTPNSPTRLEESAAPAICPAGQHVIYITQSYRVAQRCVPN